MSTLSFPGLNMIRHRAWLWLFHIIFWVLQVSLSTFVLFNFFGRVDRALIVSLINGVGHVILVYVNLGVLIPRFYRSRKFGVYAVLLLSMLIGTSGFRYIFGWQSSQFLGWGSEFFYNPSIIGGLFFGGLWVLTLSIPLALINNLYRRQELEKELKTQQLEAELRFLKAQVNPHFLFNALNNIYSLSFTNSSKAPEMILKLSDMMSYMLYDCKEEQVPLEKEINYLQNFIDLQQLKKDGEFNIDFVVEGDPTGLQVVPMLFIPFFENAFKHGNLDDLQNGWMKAEFRIIPDREIEFELANSLDANRKQYEKGGVGLENIGDRLKLLFPEKHRLEIDAQADKYSVNLIIQLR